MLSGPTETGPDQQEVSFVGFLSRLSFVFQVKNIQHQENPETRSKTWKGDRRPILNEDFRETWNRESLTFDL